MTTRILFPAKHQQQQKNSHLKHNFTCFPKVCLHFSWLETTCIVTLWNMKLDAPSRSLSTSYHSCIQMYNILSMYQFYATVLPPVSWCRGSEVRRLEHDCETNISVATLQRRSVPCKISHLTEDDWKIHVNTGMVELHDALRVGEKQDCHWRIEGFLSVFFCSTSNAKCYAAFPTCGIRFFWIRFNLDFFLPFFVTTISS